MRAPKSLSIALLILASGSPGLSAHSPAGAAGERAGGDDALIANLQHALYGSGVVARVYYRSKSCGGESGYPSRERTPVMHAPVARQPGVLAVREMFRNDPGVKVSEHPAGIVRIDIDDAPDEILRTRINLLPLSGANRYNALLAIIELQNNREMRKEGWRTGWIMPIVVTSILFSKPRSGDPLLPPRLRNMTADQALDRIARTFDGVVIFGACAEPRMFDIEFVGLDSRTWPR